MEVRKQAVLKVVAAACLVVVAAGIAFFVYEMLSSREPENALPTPSFVCGGEIPPEHWMLESYSWRFLQVVKEGQAEDITAWQKLEAWPVLAGALIEINFSTPCETLEVSRADDGSTEFEPLSGELHAPLDEGVYTYRVVGGWGSQGSIAYYFKVRI